MLSFRVENGELVHVLPGLGCLAVAPLTMIVFCLGLGANA